jgi:type IV pilus assembly protein PilM
MFIKCIQKNIRKIVYTKVYMSVFFKKEEVGQAIGLDIGTSSVKVVQLRREKDKIVLDTYGEVALGPYNALKIGQAVHLGEEKLLEAITDLFKEAKVTARDAVVAIDSSSAYVSLVHVPKVDDEQLRTMMPIEARKYIPMPLTEVQMDWWHIPATVKLDGDEKVTSVVLAAVSNTALIAYDSLVKKLELKNVEYEIHGYSLLRSSPPHTHNMVMYVDIGAQNTILSLVYQGIVLDMHVLGRGSQDSTMQIARALSVTLDTAEESKRVFGYKGDDSNPYLKDILELSSYPLFGELARLSLMYERKYNQTIEGIILTGGGSRIPGMLTSYSKTVHIAGRIVSPFEQVVVPSFLSEMMERIGPTYAVAVGCALKKLVQQ